MSKAAKMAETVSPPPFLDDLDTRCRACNRLRYTDCGKGKYAGRHYICEVCLSGMMKKVVSSDVRYEGKTEFERKYSLPCPWMPERWRVLGFTKKECALNYYSELYGGKDAGVS
jgi:hypothetical protein